MSRSHYISYEATGSFSKLVIDYLNQDEKLREFITDFPSIESIQRQIAIKDSTSIDRESLVEVLKEQYENNDIKLAGTRVGQAIDKLKDEKTFTICAAHQPNIFTGYLYTIYKIVHAINLAKECNEKISGFNFVPVFFIGSEDNDIEEIGAFNFKGKKYRWQPDETGACGRFSTQSLLEIRDEILAQFGASEAEEELKKQIVGAYNGSRTLTQATQRFIHSILGAKGLISLDADDNRLKNNFKSIIEDELVNQTSNRLVIEHNNKLSKHYKIQVEPREINLFYLNKNIRERIEVSNDKDIQWNVINENIGLEDLTLVRNFPELFSPNVILRPLYQETILPNVAFIGGGSEIAYWCELKSLFDNYDLPFPILYVRNSLSIVSRKVFDKMEKVGFEESFKPLENVLKEKSQEHPVYTKLSEDLLKQEINYGEIFLPASDISTSLEVSANAHLTKILKIHERIKTKYRAHIKREFEDLSNNRIQILEQLFPNDKLQERQENIIELVSRYGKDISMMLVEGELSIGCAYGVLSFE